MDRFLAVMHHSAGRFWPLAFTTEATGRYSCSTPSEMIRPLSADFRDAVITYITWHVSSGGQMLGGWCSATQRTK